MNYEKDLEKDEKRSLDLKKTEAALLVQEAEQAMAEAAAKAAEAQRQLEETKAKANKQVNEVRIAELGIEIKKNAAEILDASNGIQLVNKSIEELEEELAAYNKQVIGLERLIASRRATISDLNSERVRLGGSVIDIDSNVSVTQQIVIPKSMHLTETQEVSLGHHEGMSIDPEMDRHERRRLANEMVKELLEENK